MRERHGDADQSGTVQDAPVQDAAVQDAPVQDAAMQGAVQDAAVQDASAVDADPAGRYDLGLLFTDGLPQEQDAVGYKGAIAADAAGITYRQLDYWARTGLVEPTIRAAQGSGSQRLYSFRDILVLKLVKRLLDTGISLQQIRVAIQQLHAAGVRDLTQTTLISDGASVYLCTSSDEVIDLLGRGQGVFGIAVGKVLREVETQLIELEVTPADQHPVDELAARRARRSRTA